MNSKLKIVIAALLFVSVMAGAIIVYNILLPDYSPDIATIPDVESDTYEKPATDFTVYDNEGKEVKLSDFKGKPVILNLWATWCPPCKSELPDFEKMYKQYGDKVEFMMINMTDGQRETRDTAKDFININGYTFPVYYDESFSASYAYSTGSIPVTVIVDSGGTVVAHRTGVISGKELETYIKHIL